MNIDENIVIGIDLGTRFSCVSIWRNNRCEIITDQFGNNTMPSVVSFYKSAKLIGYNALSVKDIDCVNSIYDVKRILGRKSTEPVIEQVKKIVSYEIRDDGTEHNNIEIKIDNKYSKGVYKPEEICSFILVELKKMAQKYLNFPITKALITVPAYFNDCQRQATLDSAKIAGLDVIKIINEPTAAALAYGLGNRKWSNKHGGNVIVYDLGAGTLDVALMNISRGVFRTLSVSGNSHLGGEDIDYLLMNYCIREFKKKYNIENLEISKLSKIKLKNTVENSKKILSSVDKTVVCVDNFYDGKKLCQIITRKQLNLICNELFTMCIKPLEDVLESAKLTKNDIDDIIMVGGTTRIPKVRDLILKYFKGTKITNLTSSLNPDEVVSTGAAIYGYMMTHKDDPFSENLVLLDITPLSLGVETLQKQMTIIIPRNTVIPTTKTKIFSTDTDNQDMVNIRIFEGERKLTKHNFHIGTFDLFGFEKAPRGYPKIKITFHIDINGILHVSAREKRANVENSIEITSSWGAKGRLSRNDIDKLILEAEKNEQIDNMYSLKIGLTHNIKNMCEAILINLNSENCISLIDKKKILKDVKQTKKKIEREISEITLHELENIDKRFNKIYAPLIILCNDNNNQFKPNVGKVNAVDIYGDDEEIIDNKYEKVEHDNNSTENEIKLIKKTIMDLGKNIINVVNNPVSNFSEEDIILITDYIESVYIWLYTTSSKNNSEYIAKINEINKFTEEIMKKYEEKNIFEQNDNFTLRDELELTCITLNNALQSNYFSLSNDKNEKLKNIINEILEWLVNNKNIDNELYNKKINEINDYCNNLYNNTYEIKELEHVIDSDSESEEIEIIPEKNKIKEDIDSLIKNLPKKRINDDILLKIDINKLNKKPLKYKNSSH